MYTYYPKIVKNIFLPLLDISRGQETYRNLKSLNRSQWYSKEELYKLHNKRLRNIVQHSYNNVPYYNSLFKKKIFDQKK